MADLPGNDPVIDDDLQGQGKASPLHSSAKVNNSIIDGPGRDGEHEAMKEEGKDLQHDDARYLNRNEGVVGEDVEGEKETQCGIGAWHPRHLQLCNSPIGFLICLCFMGFTQGMTVNGIVYVVTTTLERRFNLPSVQSGFISSAYDFGVLLVVVFVTYFGEKAHKPRWLGIGALGFALSSFLFSLPHFTTGRYEYQSADVDTCSLDTNATLDDRECTAGSGGLSHYIGVFILAQLLHGFSASGIYTLGVTYIDENVETKRSALYLGLFQGMSTLGPALGYLIGGLFLNRYTDVTIDSQSLTISSDSPLWVGAWWLGFILTGCMALTIAFPFLMFPRSMPGSKELAMKRVSQAQKGSEYATRAGFGNAIKDFPKAFLNLVRNIPFMCVNGAAITEWFIISSLATFGPKFMETQFNISASDAALKTGFLVIPASLLGALVGGWIVTYFNFQYRGMIRFCLGSLLFAFSMLPAFAIQCPNVPFAGVSIAYTNTPVDLGDGMSNLTATCNTGCGCPTTYDPVCGTDGVLYYSACFAGCLETGEINGVEKMYTNCTCIGNSTADPSADPSAGLSAGLGVFAGSAELGRCPQSCAKQNLYIFLTFLQLVGTFLALVPSTMASIRCVSHDQRSFALGIQSLCFRAFGTIPGPVVFGALIDRVCVLWQDSCDGSACLIYDNKMFGLTALLLTMMFRLLSIFCFIGALVFYKPSDNQRIRQVAVDGNVEDNAEEMAHKDDVA